MPSSSCSGVSACTRAAMSGLARFMPNSPNNPVNAFLLALSSPPCSPIKDKTLGVTMVCKWSIRFIKTPYSCIN
ncbi:hypothetical protein [Moraxella lacunata]|uniref:hypothetical protein n=1 Tax=Moraxella lacunata TaxID=477 RepID=UPI003EE368D0